MGRAGMRLVLVVLVMAGAVAGATVLGLPTVAIVGLSIALAGIAGVVILSRRRTSTRGGAHRAASGSEPTLAGRGAGDPDGATWSVVAAMAPNAAVDPEADIPRWRRPSLLAARKSDPMRTARIQRPAMTFAATADPPTARRVVRYAVAALLDRPDEVLGLQVTDLVAGDEVEVLDDRASYWEVMCPDGMRGWIHRTTLGALGVEHPTFGRRPEPANEPDDLLTAVLSARGLQSEPRPF